jgi:hypothetical protein
LHSEETIREIVVPGYVDIHLWRHADFDDLSPDLAVDITDMTADGRPSSFWFWHWRRAIFTVISWDVWVAVAIAAVAIVFAVLFEQSPLLVFILVGSALCAYIAIRNRFDDDR